MKNILIVGGNGAIGQSLTEEFDKFPELYTYEVIDKMPNLFTERQRGIVYDVSKGFPDNIPNYDIIINLAANAKVNKSVIDPELARENFNIMWNILEYCRKQKQYSGICPKIIFSSSREVYSNLKITNKTKEEDININHCESPYAATKIACEALISAYSKCYGIDYIILRFSNVYGGYDFYKDTVIPTFIERAYYNEDLIVYGREKKLDFTYVGDLIDALKSLIDYNIKNEVLNLSSGKSERIIDIAKFIIETIGSSSNIIAKEKRIGEVECYEADLTKIKSLIEYKPKGNIYNFIEENYMNYIRRNA